MYTCSVELPSYLIERLCYWLRDNLDEWTISTWCTEPIMPRFLSSHKISHTDDLIREVYSFRGLNVFFTVSFQVPCEEDIVAIKLKWM